MAESGLASPGQVARLLVGEPDLQADSDLPTGLPPINTTCPAQGMLEVCRLGKGPLEQSTPEGGFSHRSPRTAWRPEG